MLKELNVPVYGTRLTLALLESFAARGGVVIFAGDAPAYVDALPSNQARKLAEKCTRVAFEEEAVAQAAKSGTEVRIVDGSEKEDLKKNLFVQSFRVEGGRMVMLLNVNREKDYHNVSIDLGAGAYPELWDARSGKVTRPVFRELDGRILLTMDLEKGGERIFLLADRRRELPDT